MNISTILIVDDSDADLFLHRAIIRRYDPEIEVIEAYDGQEALTKIAQLEDKPEVILLDINMPGMGGFEFLEECSKSAISTSVVAMLSSSASDEDKARASQYNSVVSYIYKPLSEADLDSLKAL